LGAGLLALALSVRPSLSWRTLQHLLVTSAQPFSIDHPNLGWMKLPSGRYFSHDVGYGRLDAWHLVSNAMGIKKNLNPFKMVSTGWIAVDKALAHPSDSKTLPDGRATPILAELSISSTAVVTQELLKRNGARIDGTEYVLVTVHIEHARRGELQVDLISPHGITSRLMAMRRFDTSGEGFQNWTMSTIAHWYVLYFRICTKDSFPHSLHIVANFHSSLLVSGMKIQLEIGL
jgi:kexin